MSQVKKNSSCSHCTEKNSMDSKFLKQSKKQVKEQLSSLLGHFTRFFTRLKKSNSLNPDGAMSVQNVEVRAGDITDSQEAERLQSKLSKPLETTFWHGNLSNEMQQLEVKKIQIHLLEEAAYLAREERKYVESEKVDTWASRWVAAPIAYLLPEEHREEWLGDLYEVNWQMLNKGYPKLMVNVVNIGRTTILIVSSLQIKLTDLFTFGVTKIK